ncbi:ABC transporter [Ktedonobacter sp. SOSP1-52]|uniref:ABC transporter ATP-binding protein n=1 Tax=Ktedonobacter sp. SOSP1-52 TaxID=2778366 RepID=UPI0019161CDF|nr:ATP-binding cassette domain-containing protein [Ktedonobacter sp. SOSP1-52]GHO70388.1 ABC transporter [Ktedonobacter sp. SOSP1-52]
MVSVISVQDISMVYKAPVREAGLRAALGSLVHRKYREIQAVRDISFELEAGEVVGFIGPNGAGKTTTMKILSGILHSTGGTVNVLGFTPWRREASFLKNIAFIRGSQPIGGPNELTVLDSLRFQQLTYEIPETAFHNSLALLVEMLKLEPLLKRQIRALSLGERMRCGLALALIYQPRILFLDEPTLGLDVTAVSMMRRFITDYSQQTQATILLTSHYMADVEELCKRVVLIDHGTLRYDGGLEDLSTSFSTSRILTVTIAKEVTPEWGLYGDVIEAEPGKATLCVQREKLATLSARLLSELPVVDLAIGIIPLEQVIDQIYQEGRI